MERFFTNTFHKQEAVEKTTQAPEDVVVSTQEKSEAQEFVLRFKHIQEDLLYLFTITVTSEDSLSYPWVKDEMYTKVIEELKLGTPFALDYMFEEKLLTKDELQSRGIEELKSYAQKILITYKGPRLTRAKNLFIECGLLTEEETKNSF